MKALKCKPSAHGACKYAYTDMIRICTEINHVQCKCSARASSWLIIIYYVAYSTVSFSAIAASCLVVDGGDCDQRCSFSSSLFVDVEAFDKGHGSSW